MRAVESLDELISKKAAEFADQIKAAAAMADKEEEIRIEAERQLAFIEKATGIKLEGKHEFTVASGRVDSVYDRVIIEYKNPSSSACIGPKADSPGSKKVIEQIKKRFYDMCSQHGQPLNSLFGVGLDGNHFIFVRFRDEKWQVQEPVEVNRHSAERFLWALFNLGQKGKPFSSEYLAGDFGSEAKTQSLFRDVSSYSFDNYRKEIASELTLAELQAFAEQFLTKHRRQLQQKGPFLEFIVPDVLKPFGLPERYRVVTFDRELAIKRTDAEFLALGHQFIDAMLSYAGSYDFGGLTAIRHIVEPKLAGRSGFLFIFIIRQRIAREDSDECLFQFEPVFSTADGQIDEEALTPAIMGAAIEGQSEQDTAPNPATAFQAAKDYLEQKAGLWDWIDDVEFLGLSWIEFK